MIDPYQCDAVSYGGYLASIPKPWRRYFPTTKRRQVRITISSWIGLDSSAKHYFVSLTEEPNPIWNTKDSFWQASWDDIDGKGLVIENNRRDSALYSMEEAEVWAREQFQKHFSQDTHQANLVDFDHPTEWMYLRDGD